MQDTILNLQLFTMYTEALDASQYILGSADDRFRFSIDLVSRLNEEGFVKLRNHGISAENVRKIFDWVGTALE